jgi:hypothetical protein
LAHSMSTLSPLGKMVQWTLGFCAVRAVEDVVRSTAIHEFVALDDVAVPLAVPCKFVALSYACHSALLLQAKQSRLWHYVSQPESRVGS